MKAQKIADIFDVPLFDGNVALGLIRYRIDPEKFPRRFPQTNAWLNQCYHKPRRSEIALHALDEILFTHGVEAISDSRFYVDRYHGEIIAAYINTGDTYATTILLNHLDKKWQLTSWGDFVESLDEREDMRGED